MVLFLSLFFFETRTTTCIPHWFILCSFFQRRTITCLLLFNFLFLLSLLVDLLFLFFLFLSTLTKDLFVAGSSFVVAGSFLVRFCRSSLLTVSLCSLLSRCWSCLFVGPLNQRDWCSPKFGFFLPHKKASYPCFVFVVLLFSLFLRVRFCRHSLLTFLLSSPLIAIPPVFRQQQGILILRLVTIKMVVYV